MTIQSISATASVARAVDPRPARSRAAILDAIAQLGASGQQLTVAAIADEAGISRTTFYTHFKDLSDIAIQLIEALYERINAVESAMRGTTAPAHVTSATTTMLLTEFHTYRNLYAAVFGPGMSGDAYRQIQAIFARGARLAIQPIAPPNIDVHAAARFIAGGTLACIVEWLFEADPEPLETLQAHILSMLPHWIT